MAPFCLGRVAWRSVTHRRGSRALAQLAIVAFVIGAVAFGSGTRVVDAGLNACLSTLDHPAAVLNPLQALIGAGRIGRLVRQAASALPAPRAATANSPAVVQ
jgi:hypothetical protein